MLGEVTVTSRRPVARRKIDRIVYDAAKLGATATTAMDVLRHTPGVVVEDGDISMPGKGKVIVLLDGREMKLDANGLAVWLASMPSDDLRRIEIMTTPPAKYSAEGQAGIINLVTRSHNGDHFGASVTDKLSVRERVFNNTSLGIKYRHGKLAAYANAGIGAGTMVRKSSDRVLYPTETWETEGRKLKSNNFVLVSLGADYDLTKQSSAGGFVSYSAMQPDADTHTATTILPSATAFESVTDFDCDYRRLNANLHYILRNVLGSGTLAVDADCLGYTISDRVDFSTTHENRLCYLNRPHTAIDACGAKADMELPLGCVTASFGTSYNYSKTANRTDYERITSGQDLNDHFVYREDILAAYADLSCRISDGWEAKGGVRTEYGRLDGNSLKTGNRTVKRQCDLFPTAFLKYGWGEDCSLALSVSGRIKRPVYVDINPFTTYTDAHSIKTGNPGLMPEKSYACELGLTLGGTFSLSGSITWRKPVISPYTTTDTLRHLTIETIDNVMRKRMYSLDASYNLVSIPWLNSTFEGSVYTIVARPLPQYGLSSTTHTSAFLYMSNNIYLNRSRTLVANLWGQYQSAEKDVAGESAARYRIDLGVKWSIFKKMLTVGLECQNMIASHNRTIVNGNATTVTHEWPPYRVLNFSVALRFGKNTDVRQRKADFGSGRL